MRLKNIIIYVFLLGGGVAGGLVTQKYCHRFPTEEEMADYHASHFSTKLIKLESEVFTKKADDREHILFKGLHQPSGIDEIYFVEAGRRWVMPWNQYNWKSEDKE